MPEMSRIALIAYAFGLTKKFGGIIFLFLILAAQISRKWKDFVNNQR